MKVKANDSLGLVAVRQGEGQQVKQLFSFQPQPGQAGTKKGNKKRAGCSKGQGKKQPTQVGDEISQRLSQIRKRVWYVKSPKA